jgi:hypothetical protein
LRERQIIEFVHNHGIDAHEAVSNAVLAATKPHTGFERIDEVDGVEDERLAACPDDAARDAYGDMALAGARTANKKGVPLCVEEGTRSTASGVTRQFCRCTPL